MSEELTGWIGVDLDGTWAKWDRGSTIDRIGPPIDVMTARVRGWLEQGIEVRIFTARVGRCEERNDDGIHDNEEFARRQEQMIKDWTRQVLGRELRVTASKDFRMIQLWDDRVVEVITNTGLPRYALGR